MLFINQARIGRDCGAASEFCRLAHNVLQFLWNLDGGRSNPIFHRVDAARVKCNRHNDKILRFEFFVNTRPDWQVKTAASPPGPGEQQDFLAPIVRQGMRFSIQIGQRKVLRLERGERIAA